MLDQDLTFDKQIFVFETVMRVRSTEIDMGQHLTLESFTALLSEARQRFLYSRSIKEINADYQSLIVDNLQLSLTSRVRAREELLFEVGIEQLFDDGGYIVIKSTRTSDGSLVAKARLHFINFDFRTNKVTVFNSIIKAALERSY